MNGYLYSTVSKAHVEVGLRQCRLGIPTASQFSRIVTPTGQLSKARDGYLAELLCEWVMGEPADRLQIRMDGVGSGH